jgi:hypothetical protein
MVFSTVLVQLVTRDLLLALLVTLLMLPALDLNCWADVAERSEGTLVATRESASSFGWGTSEKPVKEAFSCCVYDSSP